MARIVTTETRLLFVLREEKNKCCPGAPVEIIGGFQGSRPVYMARCSCGKIRTPWTVSIEDARRIWNGARESYGGVSI